MHERDTEDENIWKPGIGYMKNPTATDIEDAVQGQSIIFQGRKANGKMTYVVNGKGHLIFGKRANPANESSRTPHPMLIGGKNPKVKVAGMIEFRNGKIYAIDNDSGHYRPPEKSLKEAEVSLARLPREVFHRYSRWRKK